MNSAITLRISSSLKDAQDIKYWAPSKQLLEVYYVEVFPKKCKTITSSVHHLSSSHYKDLISSSERPDCCDIIEIATPASRSPFAISRAF